jgi:hypothetical protein
MIKPQNAAIIYAGPSLIDGSEIVVVVTGILGTSSNDKTTGALPLAQTYILPRAMLSGITGMNQAEDYRAWYGNLSAGRDAAACGECSKRPSTVATIVASGATGLDVTDPCYVRNGPQGAAAAVARGAYPVVPVETVAIWLEVAVRSGRIAGLRGGAWGDPAAAPLSVHAPLFDAVRAATQRSGKRGVTTCYTRTWTYAPTVAQGWSRYAMASAHSVSEARLARSQGWRPFMVVDPRNPAETGGAIDLASEDSYLHCPASRETGADVSCSECGACNGGKGPIVGIASHGARTRGAKACAAADAMLARVRESLRAKREARMNAAAAI